LRGRRSGTITSQFGRQKLPAVVVLSGIEKNFYVYISQRNPCKATPGAAGKLAKRVWKR